MSRDYDTDAPFAALSPFPSMPERPSDPDASAAADSLAAGPGGGLRERPSKTRRKQESHDLQSLGEALLELPDDHLATLGLGESLVDAIRTGRRIKSHEARRRQMQLIGKLMRSADVEPIRQAVADMQLGRARDSLALHQAERWRAELIADDEATTRFATPPTRRRRAAAARARPQRAQGRGERARAAQRPRLPRAVPVHPRARRR